MTTQKKVEKLKLEGWVVSFNENDFTHIATRGCIKVVANSITELYKFAAFLAKRI